MSKTIIVSIVSILGVSVIAYAVISKDSWELSTNESDSASILEQGQVGVTNQDNGANNSAQLALSQREFESGTDAELLEATKINSFDQKRKLETKKRPRLPEEFNASVEDLQIRKTDPENIRTEPLQSIDDVAQDIDTRAFALNNEDIDTRVIAFSNKDIHTSDIALNNNASDGQGLPATTLGLSRNSSVADDGNLAETNTDDGLSGDEEGSSDTEVDDSDTGETNDDDDDDTNDDDDDTNDDDDDTNDDDDDAGGLAGRWTGKITANQAGNGCEGANMSITLLYDDIRTRYFLGGSVVTFPGHLNINKRVPFSITGLVTDGGGLNAKLSQVVHGFGVSNYQVSYSGSLSDTQGSGTWSDNSDCSGTWDLSKK